MPRIGFVTTGTREQRASHLDAFLAGLRELGYVDGQTITIEWRFTDAGPEVHFNEIASELVSLPVDLIVVYGSTPAAMAAQQATSTIPIIAVAVTDPVLAGLVPNQAHPGGNVTALAIFEPGIFAKDVQLLRDLLPGLARVTALVEIGNPGLVASWGILAQAAEATGIQAERIDIRSADELETAFESAAMRQAEAVVSLANPILLPVQARFVELTLQHRLPSVNNVITWVEAGMLMYYGEKARSVIRGSAVYVDKILNGANPGDLPVLQPTEFDLIVNLKTARELGITIPPELAPQVTGWIQ